MSSMRRFFTHPAAAASSSMYPKINEGWNMYGQLGDNTKMNRTAPVMATMFAGVTFIVVSAKYQHSMALDRDDNIWTWGYNTYCQLSIGSRNATKTAIPAHGEHLSILINGQATTGTSRRDDRTISTSHE